MTPLLADRRLCLVLVGVVVGHFAAAEVGLSGWQCPVRHTLHVPCPGCGLTRATKLLLQGEWSHSLQVHAFAPAVVLFAALLVVSLVLPIAWRQFGLGALAKIEQRTHVTTLILLALVGYWLVRILFFRSSLYLLVM